MSVGRAAVLPALGRLVREQGVAAAGFAALAALVMWPVLRAPHERVYGLPSDPLGEVWRLGLFRSGDIGLLGDGVTNVANAPSGVDLRWAIDATQILYDAPAWVLAQALEPVLAYNLLVWVAIWSGALAAYWALRHLGAGRPGAATAGLLFMLAPVHMVEAQLHVGLAVVAPLPVLLAAGVTAIRRPGIGAGAAVGAVGGACAYVTAYLALEAAVLALALVVLAAAAAAADPSRRRGIAVMAAAAAASALVVVTPLVLLLAAFRGSIGAAVGTPASELEMFALEPGDLLRPGSPAYIGLAGVALALGGAIWGSPGRVPRLSLAAVALAGVAFSLAPSVADPLGLPAPASVVHAIVPYWRVYGRVEIVASLGIAGLAGLAIDRLARRPQVAARVGAAVLGAIAVGELVREPPPPAADRGRADPLAQWLASRPGAVAEYPLFGFEDYRLGGYLFRQLGHERPLLNGAVAGSLAADLAAAAPAADAPQAPAALAIAGVRSVVVHPGGVVPGAAEIRLRRTFPDGARGYDVPVARPAAVAVARSAHAAEAGADGLPFTWLSPDAELRVAAGCAGRVLVRLTAVSQGVPRAADFGAARRRIGTAPTPLRLRVTTGADGRASVAVRTVPVGTPLPGGDPRVAGIGISGISAVASCGLH